MAEPGPVDDHFRKLFTKSPDMLAIAADGYLTHVNPAWTSRLGWSAEELVARRFLDFVHPEDLVATRRIMRQLSAGLATDTFRNRLLHEDGTYRVLRWSLQPHDDLVFVSARDISVYAALRERAERSEAVASSILQTAVDPIIVIDTAGVIVDANPATSDMFGYPLEDLVDRNVSMLMPEPYRVEHDGYIHRYLTEGNPRIIGIGREVEAQRADGSVFPMALAVSEIRTEHDHLFTGIIHDLSERNRQRDELRSANVELEERVADRTDQLNTLLDELRRSNQDLEQFAYIASHDLQAPLRNVRQGLELLDEHLEDTIGTSFDDEAHELRDLVVAAVRRMEELIKGLLAYSRVQQSPRDAHETLNLHELVADVASMLEPDVVNAGGTIAVEALPTITGNAVQLRQVFQNLIENAIRYRSPDRPLAITIRCREMSESDVLVEVHDNGSGIDSAHHERIFELFRRGQSGYEGVGLGLAICKRVVEGHNGTISVESSVNEGSAFCLRLPRRGGSQSVSP